MIEVFVAGIGLIGPGMPSWPDAVPVLAGRQAPGQQIPPLPPPPLLAANERRRAGTVVRLALAVAQQATAMAGAWPGGMRSVFASSNGDGAVIHAILETLADPHRQMSPTQFHNSVHNATAGYWSIGTRSSAPTTSLGCHDATAAAALLKAAAEAQVEREPVLLCLYDAPLPEPLGRARPTEHVFGAALVLTPALLTTQAVPAAPLARLRLDWRADATGDATRDAAAQAGASVPRVAALRALYAANPAARILPILEAIAVGASTTLALPLLDGQVIIDLESCSTARASSA
jgi:hypothetical protein